MAEEIKKEEVVVSNKAGSLVREEEKKEVVKVEEGKVEVVKPEAPAVPKLKQSKPAKEPQVDTQTQMLEANKALLEEVNKMKAELESLKNKPQARQIQPPQPVEEPTFKKQED